MTQKELDYLKSNCKTWSTNCKETRQDLDTIGKSLITTSDKTEHLEGQSRRHNIVVDGLKESARENVSESEEKVRKLFCENLQLDQRKIELEWAHRVGNQRALSEKPRPIVVRFLRLKDKLAVLDKAKNLKGTGIFINEDFPETIRQRRRELLPAMKAARERSDIAYLRYDKLIVHPPFQNQPTQRKPNA